MNIQQALCFSFLKKTKPIKQKSLTFNNGANKSELIDMIGFKLMLISL